MKNVLVTTVLMFSFLLSGASLAYGQASQWTQTTQADFEAGELTALDTQSNPGDVQLEKALDLGPGVWRYRNPIEITGSTTETLTNYEVMLTIDTSALVAAGKMQETGNDIRFLDSSLNEIPYWIGSGMNTTSTKIYVKVDSIPPAPDSTMIFVYYGNPVAASKSSGDNTFQFFNSGNFYGGDFEQIDNYWMYGVTTNDAEQDASNGGGSIVQKPYRGYSSLGVDPDTTWVNAASTRSNLTISLPATIEWSEMTDSTSGASVGDHGLFWISDVEICCENPDYYPWGILTPQFDNGVGFYSGSGFPANLNIKKNGVEYSNPIETPGLSPNEWHRFALKIGPNGFVNASIDGEEYSLEAGAEFDLSGMQLYLAMFSDPTPTRNKYWFDDILVRTFASGEPSVNILPAEDQTGYYSNGSLVSQVHGQGSPVDFDSISWDSTSPIETGTDSVRFQLATNNDNATWNFVGPDGTPDTFYTAPGQTIWTGHNGDGYVKYKLFLSTENTYYSPTLHDVTINMIDISPPITTTNIGDQWYQWGLHVNLTAVDSPGTGVDKIEYSFDGSNWTDYTTQFWFYDEGVTTFYYRAIDNAGHVEPTNIEEIKIDKTNPVITLNSPDNYGPVVLGSTVTVDWSANDALSGIASATATFPNGSTLDTRMIGIHSFTVTATDNAGRTSTKTIFYTVALSDWELFEIGYDQCTMPASADGNLAAITDADSGGLYYFDLESKQKHFTGINGWYPSIKNNLIAYFDDNGSLGTYDVENGTITSTDITTAAEPNGFAPNRYFSGEYIAYGDSRDYRLKLYSIATQEIIDTSVSLGTTSWNTYGEVSIDGNLVTYELPSGQIGFYDIQTGAQNVIEDSGYQPVVSGDIISYVGDSGSDTRLKFYRISTGEVVDTGILEINSQSIDGDLIVANTDPGNIMVYRISTSEVIDTGLYGCTGQWGACWVEISGDMILSERYEPYANIRIDGSWEAIYAPEDLNGDGWDDGSCVAIYSDLHVDDIAPISSANLTGVLGDNDWYTSDVEAVFTAEDNVSGLGVKNIRYQLNSGSWTTYEETVSVTTEGINDIQHKAMDDAGNVEATKTTEVKIDKTAPLVAVNTPIDQAEYLLNKTVVADWSTSDGVSGIASATGTVPSGQPIDTSSPGQNTFTVVAIDNAGNTTTETITYYVRYDYGGILQPIEVNGSSLFRIRDEGSVVQVKFQLKDANDDYAAGAVASILVTQTSEETSGNTHEQIVDEPVTPGISFLYDSATDEYYFNYDTDRLEEGTSEIRIDLDDGTSKYVTISLR